MEFKISELLSLRSAISASDGDKLYDLIFPKLEHNFNNKIDEDVFIDFSNIDDLTTAFINNSIAKLFYTLDSEYLFNVLKFKNFSNPTHVNLIKLSLSNALLMKGKK
ncbi:STAS-like domain-containing protein [Clostridium perfringens]|jgi:hypothetical protein|uniref:STAS-like domain-containing protein n=1 Tax=Clostridium perfringens TaxID=1502 RepID=UPI0024BCD7C4|nr:STAS-like domain-containing protein [Clostridium perfringens]MDK0903547.1 STAS-like domain-containing protein [Clostridium perfringens]MDM0892550.1 STAS-like domain-containing protein [Clostridium perfringens]MDM0936547.1 STAS-like domain-containing protein [Clostridium perfringens]